MSPICAENRQAVLDLELEDYQVGYLPDPTASLRQAAEYPDARPFAVERNCQVVGFGLYGIDEATSCWKLFRLMIDRQHQRQGLGRAALTAVIVEMRALGADDILVCYQDQNAAARKLYLGFGFQEYGQEGSKVLARLPAAA